MKWNRGKCFFMLFFIFMISTLTAQDGLSYELDHRSLESNPYETLNNAIASYDDITFPTESSGETYVLTGHLVIPSTRKITIEGPTDGVTLSGDDKTRLFKVDGDLTIKDLTLTRGAPPIADLGGNGGAILCGGNLKAERCNFTSCKAFTFGGAVVVHNSSGEGSFNSCSFINNKNEKYGGAIYSETLKNEFTNCTFFNNDSTYGGAVYISNKKNTTTASNCTFYANTATSFADSSYLNSSKFIVVNSIFWGERDRQIYKYNDCTIVAKNCIIRGGYEGDNIITDDPVLSDPAYNGGSCKTCSVGRGSSALGSGLEPGIYQSALGEDEFTILPVDQRGVERPLYSPCDIGSYEARELSITLSRDITMSLSCDMLGQIEDDVKTLKFIEKDEPTFSFRSGEGSSITGANLDGVPLPIKSDNIFVYKFAPISSDHVLEVISKPNPSIKGIVLTGKGTIEANPEVVKPGESSQALILAEPHYHIEEVFFNNPSSVTGDGKRYYKVTFDNITSNILIKVSFDIDVHDLIIDTVLWDGDASGRVTPSSGRYEYGSEVSLRAVPASNATFIGWSESASGLSNPLSIIVDGDKRIKAHFDLKKFSINSSTEGGGIVAPEKNIVKWGKDRTLYIIPNEGYKTEDVIIDGTSIGSVSSYTFEDIRSNHTLKAVFKKTPSPDDPDPAPIEGDINFTDDGGAGNAVLEGSVNIELPDGLDLTKIKLLSSKDIETDYSFNGLCSKDLSCSVSEDCFLCGVSFDIDDINGSELGMLPVRFTMVISRDKMSQVNLEEIEKEASEVTLCEALLNHVNIMKIISEDIYYLSEIVKKSGQDAKDFFAVEKDLSGNFKIEIGLLIVDAPSDRVPSVQTVPSEGDCRFLIFDGKSDGKYCDPIVASEKTNITDDPTRSGGSGCSSMVFPGTALLIIPLVSMLLKEK